MLGQTGCDYYVTQCLNKRKDIWENTIMTMTEKQCSILKVMRRGLAKDHIVPLQRQ